MIWLLLPVPANDMIGPSGLLLVISHLFADPSLGVRRTTFLEKLHSRYLLVVGTLHYGSPLRMSMTLIMKLGASQVVKMWTTILPSLSFDLSPEGHLFARIPGMNFSGCLGLMMCKHRECHCRSYQWELAC
jgi:hypothetical protein